MDINIFMKDYEFIEIGTSDFNTLIEKANNDTIGMSVEPLEYYLNRLPNRTNVIKVNCAISIDGSIGTNKIYYIPDKTIQKNNLSYYLRGCNCLGDYHWFHKKYNLEKYVKIKNVDQLPLSTLLEKYSVRSIEHLKIDTEGNDSAILQSFFPFLKKQARTLFPKKISFETNFLTPKHLVQQTLDMYATLGYTNNYKETKQDTLMML